MAKDCPGCNPLTNQKRTRWLVFTEELTDRDLQWVKADVIITRACYPRGRFGHSAVCCACGPAGSQKLGASSVVVWGRNTKKLYEVFESTSAPIVFVALLPGTPTSGKSVAKIQRACAEAGRECHVVEFATRPTCHVDPTLDPQVVFARVGPPPAR